MKKLNIIGAVSIVAVISLLLTIQLGGVERPKSFGSATPNPPVPPNTSQERVSHGNVFGASSSVKARPLQAQDAAWNTALRKKTVETDDLNALLLEVEKRSDPEAKFTKALIFDTCGSWKTNYKGMNAEQYAQQQIAKFTGINAKKREAIYREHVLPQQAVHLCRNFDRSITQADTEFAYKQAADAGDIRGQLDQLWKSFLKFPAGSENTMDGDALAKLAFSTELPLGPTAAQVDLLHRALASKDPAQILFAGTLLTSGFSDFEVRFSDGVGIQFVGNEQLWRAVACHYAQGCAEGSPAVLTGCAVRDRCEIGSYEETLQKHKFTIAEWNKFQQYKAEIITAIDSGNWAALQETRGASAGQRKFIVSPTPTRPRFITRF